MDQDVEELVDLTTCTPKVGGRSFVWKSELFVLDPLKQPVCTACGVRVPAGNGTTQSNTTNLICHYESRRSDKTHAEKLEKARKEYEENKTKGSATPKRKGSAKSTLRRRVFEDLLNWMIMARQPLQAPEHPLLRKALQTATGNPSFNCGGQKEFREALLAKRDQATTVLKEMLKGATPAVTADIWTSNTNMGFIALTVHFIQPSKIAWVMRKGTAACEVFEGSRSAAHVGAKIVDMLKKLGVLQSVVSVTSDTTSNIKSGVENHTTDSIAWVGCAAHKMESTVLKCVSTPALKASLAAFIGLSAHLSKSPLSQQAFEAAQKVRFKHKAPEKIPLGCAERWWSWWSLLSVCLEHKSSLVSTIEIANDRLEGPEIVVSYEDWRNARVLVKLLEPFHEAMQALEGDDITLPLLPCVMSVLNSHVDAATSGEDDNGNSLGGGGGGGASGTRVAALLDKDDRWQEPSPVVKIATALSARTKGLEWLEEEERATWQRLVLRKCREMLRSDITAERAAAQKEAPSASDANADDDGAPAADPALEDAMDEQPLKKQKISFLARCIEAKGGGGGAGGGGGVGGGGTDGGAGSDGGAAGQEQQERAVGAFAGEVSRAGGAHAGVSAGAGVGGVSSGNNPNLANLSLVARMRVAEAELTSFVAEEGLDPDDGGSDELGWWCQHQEAFPTLARLAVVYLAIPATSAASESVSSEATAADTVKTSRKQLADDTGDALVFLSGSHGLAWSSGLSEEELARSG